MEPPFKRARTDSLSHEGNINAAMPGNVASKPKQHESLWFDDGNIVLATDVHLYCVHKSILAKNSSVFKDMFELPNIEGTVDATSVTNADSWEGKPLVRMIGDSDEDVYHLLMTFYELGFYIAYTPTTFDIISSLLRMSTKYNVTNLRNNVINHIGRVYPCTLEGMENRNFDDLLLGPVPDYHDFRIFAVAQECNARILLPLLYFDCATCDLKYILEATRACSFGRDEQTDIILGYQRLSKLTYEFAFKTFAPQRVCNSNTCTKSRGKLLTYYMDFETYRPPYFPVDQLLLRRKPSEDDKLKGIRATICKACTDKSDEALDAFRLRVWEKLPKIFGLGTWEDVKRDD